MNTPNTKIAWLDLSPHYGLISARGDSVIQFLQGQLTLDLQSLKPLPDLGDPVWQTLKFPSLLSLAAYCNPKGRIRALFRLLYNTQGILLQLPIGLLPKISSELKKYARFSRVEIKEHSDEWIRIGIITDANTLTTLQSQFITLGQTDPQSLYVVQHPSLESQGSQENPQKPLRIEIIAKKVLEDPILHLLQSSPSVQVSQKITLNDWILQEIRDQIPEVWPQTQEQFLPHHLNLPNLGAVSFSKGCYCGQEIIARMHYLGKIKRTVQYFHEDPQNTTTIQTSLPIPEPGTLFENIAQSIVISSAWNENQRLELLLEANTNQV